MQRALDELSATGSDTRGKIGLAKARAEARSAIDVLGQQPRQHGWCIELSEERCRSLQAWINDPAKTSGSLSKTIRRQKPSRF